MPVSGARRENGTSEMTQIDDTTDAGQEAAAPDAGERYDADAIQERWLPVWDELAPFRSGRPDDERPAKYILDMFPYPSGDLHMGHAEAYALGDVVARYWVQRGFNVMHPIGWDAFGLPAENAAITRGLDPRGWTYENIAQQKASMRRYACSFDWDRVLQTCDPGYYRWNQWLFLQLYKRGLAYRGSAPVNWCPSDQTVLANEQVVEGRCERCGTEVVQRELEQWFLKITEYADRLDAGLDSLEHWPDKVKTMQRNWIGRSVGADVRFDIPTLGKAITIFTTRPDTIYGATFMVLAPEHPDVPALIADHPQVPAEHALRGFDGVRAYTQDAELSRPLLEQALAFEPGADGWEVRGAARGSTYAYDPPPAAAGIQGAGTIHHVAWASPMDDHEAWRDAVLRAGGRPTPVIDRFYFRSVYFREPSGVLFEIATIGPGFATDEPQESLGQKLALPPNYEHLRDQIERTVTPLPPTR